MADPKSWNPWHGCRRYSEGCKFFASKANKFERCYMFVLDKAHHVPESSTEIVRTKMFGKPLEMTRKGWYKTAVSTSRLPSGYTLRVNMTSDTFLEEADGWRTEMWSIIRRRPDGRLVLTTVFFYILTKRVPRIMECLPGDWGDGYENVDLNMTCETQRAFDERWPIFRDIPARHNGIRSTSGRLQGKNLAPMLTEIDITSALASGQIENVNLGGEGFGGDRPCHYEWIRRVSDDCTKYRVNFTVNAIGSHFVKDGRTYHIDSQQEQGRQAYRSGLSRFFGKPKYRLYHPVDGHLLEEGELMVPRFNVHRCLECTSAPLCVGCTDCGSCKQVELVSYDELIKLRRKSLLSCGGQKEKEVTNKNKENMTQITYHKVRVEDCNVFYREAGNPENPTILLLHGFPSASHMFRELMPELMEQRGQSQAGLNSAESRQKSTNGQLADEFHLIAPDFPSFGQTESPSREEFEYSFDHLAKIVNKFTEAVGLTKFAMYVFDYGAPIGYRLAMWHPERITAIISQNGNMYEEGLGKKWEARKAYWKNPTPELRNQFSSAFALETIIGQYTFGTPEGSVGPDGYSLDYYYVNLPGRAEMQNDLILDYRSNVALYPEFQKYLRDNQPPLLAVWGENDPSFIPAGANAFKRDLPNAEIHFVPSGHFALESHHTEIAALMREFLERVLK